MKTCTGILLVLLACTLAHAEESTVPDDREYLVPAMEDAGLKISDGTRRFARHFSVSPAVGRLGEEELFAMRLAYNPRSWMGYEISLGHNPASSLHALLHTFNVLLRYPLSGRFQPYANIGYGMMTVYPGQAVKADPVTKNTLAYGGGLEVYIRDDVALRGEMRVATVIGQDPGQQNNVAYHYREYTLGLVFYRDLGN